MAVGVDVLEVDGRGGSLDAAPPELPLGEDAPSDELRTCVGIAPGGLGDTERLRGEGERRLLGPLF